MGFVPLLSLLVAIGAFWTSREAYLVADQNFKLNEPSLLVSGIDAEMVGLTYCCFVIRVDFVVFNLRNQPVTIRSLVGFDRSENSEPFTAMDRELPYTVAPMASVKVSTLHTVPIRGKTGKEYLEILTEEIPSIDSYSDEAEKLIANKEIALSVLGQLMLNIDQSLQFEDSSLQIIATEFDCDQAREAYEPFLYICPSLYASVSNGREFVSDEYFLVVASYIRSVDMYTEFDFGWAAGR